MENTKSNNENKKLTPAKILFFSLLGLALIWLKFYFTRSDFCHDSCVSIKSELDVMKCLDACAVNGNDFKAPITFKKVFGYLILVVSLALILIKILDTIFINKNGNKYSQKIIQMLERLKEMKDSFFSKGKDNDYSYKKFDDKSK